MKNKNKSIIVRTKKGNTVGCYSFLTMGHQQNKPSIIKTFASTPTAWGQELDINYNLGGDTFVMATHEHPNGFDVIETFVFPREFVTGIEIETDFKEFRNK